MISLLPVLVIVSAAQLGQPIIIKTPQMEIDLTPRTANQMASFYEARGFPKAMRDVISSQCFITVGITNTTDTRIWHDLANWSFTAAGKSISREHRDAWKERWQAMGMPMSKQATFRWTLIPESLDYLPGEHEGGNIVLPFTEGYFTVTATFATGDDKQGKPITISSDKLFCAEDPQ